MKIIYSYLDISHGHSLHVCCQNVGESLQFVDASASVWHLNQLFDNVYGGTRNHLLLVRHERDTILADDSVHFLTEFFLKFSIF